MKTRMVVIFLSLCLVGHQLASGARAQTAEQAWKQIEEGKTLHNNFRFTEAEKLFSQALKAFESNAFNPGIAAASERLGLLFHDVGIYPRAVQAYEKALRVYTELAERMKEADILVRLGLVHDDWGDLPGSLAYYTKALALEQHLSEKQRGEIFFGLSELYYRMGDHAEALKQGERALKAFRQIMAFQREGETLVHLASIHRVKGKNADALNNYEEAIKVFIKGNQQQAATEARLAVGALHLDQSKINEAEKVFSASAYPIGLGQIALKLRAFRDAVNYFNEALRNSEMTVDLEWQFAATIGLGLAYENMGMFKEADGALREAVAALEELRDSLPEGRKLYFLAGKSREFSRVAAYEALVRVLKAQGKQEEAFHFTEYTRGRVLTEAIGGMNRTAFIPESSMTTIPDQPTLPVQTIKFGRVPQFQNPQQTPETAGLFHLLLSSTEDGFGPEKEQKAHALALDYFTKSGYSPDAFNSLLAKLRDLKQRGLANHLTSGVLSEQRAE